MKMTAMGLVFLPPIAEDALTVLARHQQSVFWWQME